MIPGKSGVWGLFEVPKQYVIPLYQRRYVWSRDKQWEPLWQDIVRCAEEALADPTADAKTVKPHFLGAVVLSRVPKSSLEMPTYDVIDGQQRLTTFQLFLAAFRDVAAGLNLGAHPALLGVTTNVNYVRSPQDEFKVWPTHFDQAGFVQALRKGGATEAEATVQAAAQAFEHVPNTLAAYAYFKAALRQWLTEGGQQQARGDALHAALLDRLQVVTIDLEAQDDPQVIFETLNARGEPLQPADLVRNHIFSTASARSEDTARLFNLYWKDFDEDGSVWRQPESRGRFVRDRLTWFLVAFLTVKLDEDVSDSMIFDAFKRWWAGCGTASAESGLQELRRYARVYVSVVQAPHDTRLGLLRRRLDVLEVSSLTPLLLYLVAEAGVSGAVLDGILHDLESFLVRRFMLGLGGKNYNLLFLRLLREVRHLTAPAEIRAQLLATLSRGSGDSVRWPQDAEITNALVTLPAYRKWKPRGVSMVLEAVEPRLATDKQEQVSITTPLSVEHVLPQKWHLWPAPVAPEGVSDPVGWRNALLHSLGNLTLTTQRLNSSVSNSEYDRKREALEKHSVLRLNHEVIKEPTWDETVIQRRSRDLATIIVSIWRGPDAVAVVGPNSPTPVIEPLPSASDTLESLRHDLGQLRAVGFWLGEDSSGAFRLYNDDWGSRSLRYLLRTVEDEDGEEQFLIALEDAFGPDTPQKPFVQALMGRLAQPVQLAFGEERVQLTPSLISVRLAGDEPARRVWMALRKLIQLSVPSIEAAFSAYQATLTQARPPLDILADVLRPGLPQDFSFMVADTFTARPYRRIANAVWPQRARSHYELLQRGEQLLVCLHDEQPKSAPTKAALIALWPQLTQAAQDAFPDLDVKGHQHKSGTLSIEVPTPANDSAVVLDILGRLITATAPLIERAWPEPTTITPGHVASPAAS